MRWAARGASPVDGATGATGEVRLASAPGGAALASLDVQPSLSAQPSLNVQPSLNAQPSLDAAAGAVRRLARRLSPLFFGHHVHRRAKQLAALVALMALLQLAGGIGVAYLAGFTAVRRVLGHFDWRFLVLAAGALAVSFAGYYFAYRSIYRVESGPGLSRRQLAAVVMAGFGGFLAHGGSALDCYAVQAAGADEREAKVRTSSLGGLEHGVLGIVCMAAAIAVLVEGLKTPPTDFTMPWALVPLPGFLLAFWLAERVRPALHRSSNGRGWREPVSIFADGIHLIRQMFTHPVRYGPDLVGMAVFWLADMVAAWAGLAAFGFQMSWPAFIVGFGTGLLFTRRTGPMGGAGVLGLVLPLTLWASGAPLAVAAVGIFAYRVLCLWLPLPLSLATLPTLRAMGEHRVPHAEGLASPSSEPALRPQGA